MYAFESEKDTKCRLKMNPNAGLSRVIYVKSWVVAWTIYDTSVIIHNANFENPYWNGETLI